MRSCLTPKAGYQLLWFTDLPEYPDAARSDRRAQIAQAPVVSGRVAPTSGQVG